MAHAGYSLLLQKLYVLPQGFIPVRGITNFSVVLSKPGIMSNYCTLIVQKIHLKTSSNIFIGHCIVSCK
jgi:hypothetical protein